MMTADRPDHDSGPPTAFRGAGRDASGRPGPEERFRTIFEDAGIGIALVDSAGRLIKGNPALRQILGYAPDELRGRHFAEVTHPDDVEKDRRLFDELVRGERRRYHIEKRYIRRDGETLWGRLTVSSIRDDGEFRCAIGMLEDITDEKRAQSELARSEARARRRLAELEALYRNAPVGLCVVDPDLRYLRINDRLAEINGLPADRHIGRTVRDVVPDLADEAEPAMRKVLETGEPVLGIELTGETSARPGETRHWIEHYFPIREDGRVVGLNVVVEEITDRKHMEAELRRAKNAAEAASRAKTEFLAVVSHELRTPLTAVVGYANLLEAGIAGELGEAQREYVDRIEESAEHLREVIDQILQVAALDTGRESVRTAGVDVARLARSLADTFRPRAEQKGLRFHMSAPDRPLEVRTDPEKLRLILFSLLSNAVKFTREGRIEMSVRPTDDHIRFEVCDTGPGIATDALERVFERFSLAEEAHIREHGGLGLGLALSRRLAHLLGGTLTVESEVGKGSTFTLTIPRTGDTGPEGGAERG